MAAVMMGSVLPVFAVNDEVPAKMESAVIAVETEVTIDDEKTENIDNSEIEFDKEIEEFIEQDDYAELMVTGIRYGDYLYYTVLDDGTVEISDCDSSATGEIVIPSEIDGKSVTSIGEWAFSKCGGLMSVTISDSVMSIGELAFYECSGLMSVTISDSVTSIGFAAFMSCSNLTSVTIGNSVASIGNEAFAGCRSLTSVTIGNSVTSIGNEAFNACNKLTTIEVNEDNVNYSSVDGSLFNKDKTELIQYAIGKQNKKYTIPYSVIEILNGAFENCRNLENVIIPDSVTRIGNSAFKNCSNLTSVTIPNSVMCLGEFVFDGTNLKSLSLSNKMIEIPRYSFSICRELTDITIPKNITLIEENAFLYCDNIKDIYYEGSEKDWSEITIEDYNDSLVNATIHCNSQVKEKSETINKNIDNNKMSLNGTVSYNVSGNNYSARRAASTVKSYLIEDNKLINRVEYVSAEKGIVVESYFNNGMLKNTITIDAELDIFGGFYSGEKYNFLVFGQQNKSESDECEIMRIVKYSKDWVRLGKCSVYGANTYIPFDAGSLRMTETGGLLYIHTCHDMYKSNDGLHHQANMTYVMNEELNEITQSCYYVAYIGVGYVSHSFNQFIQTDGKYVYRVDHGDAYPRAVSITKCNVNGSITNVDYTLPLKINGVIGDNDTGVSIGGFELSENNCLIAGTSVDMSDENTYDPYGLRNIFVSITDKDLKKSRIVWLTDYDDEITVYTPHLINMNDGNYAVLWEENDGFEISLKVAIINENGEKKSEFSLRDFRLSDCKPIMASDGFIKWYTTTGKKVYLYVFNPYICKYGDLKIDNYSVNDQSASVTVSNNTSEKRRAEVIIAGYNGDDMVSVNSQTVSFNARQTKDIVFDNIDGNNVREYKIMIWDSFNMMKPIDNAITYK